MKRIGIASLILGGMGLVALAQPPEMADEGMVPPPPPGAAEEGPPPPGPPAMMGMHGRPPGPPMSPDRIEGFLQRHLPERARELQELRQGKPHEYQKLLHRLGPRVQRLTHLEQRDPEEFARALSEFQAEDRLQAMVKAFQKAPKAERAELKTQMKPLVAQLFDFRQEREQKRLQQMKKEVEILESRLKQRQENKDPIVDSHLNEITRDESLRW